MLSQEGSDDLVAARWDLLQRVDPIVDHLALIASALPELLDGCGLSFANAVLEYRKCNDRDQAVGVFDRRDPHHTLFTSCKRAEVAPGWNRSSKVGEVGGLQHLRLGRPWLQEADLPCNERRLAQVLECDR